MTAAPAPPPSAAGAPTGPAPHRTRRDVTAYRSSGPVVLVTLYVLLLVSLVARTLFTLWEPTFDGAVQYEDVRRLGGNYWPMNLYLGGPGYALSWVSAAALMSLLSRGRSTAVTLLGSLLAGVGGVVFALVITAETLPFSLASELPEPQGRALFDALNARLDLVIPAIVGATATTYLLQVALVAGLGWFGLRAGLHRLTAAHPIHPPETGERHADT